MRLGPLALLCAGAVGVASAATLHTHQFSKRDGASCDDLRIDSNKGDRKVAIVIDSSGSMSSTDRNRYRVAASKNLNNFLISNARASSSSKADLVTVVDFDDLAYVRYPLGDPANAGPAFDKIDASGGTNIALGVRNATAALTAGGGDTDKRSAIVVFTDGEVSQDPFQLIIASTRWLLTAN
jgi:Mg-chelatase subunit ChlD